MNKTIKLFVNEKENDKRVDIFLSEKINFITRSYIKKHIENGSLFINDVKNISPSKKIRKNDIIKFSFSEIENKLAPNKIELDIIYEDKDLIIVNKPKGMVVHPGAGNYKNTLANALAFKYKKNLSNINGDLRPGIIHRIDKETSGLLVVAKNNFSHANLGKQFSNHTIKRKYKCLSLGVIRPLNGRIETLISRSKKNRQIMTVSEFNGKKAITNYKTIKVYNLKNIPKISLIECNLETGRTHQIRVHLKYKGSTLLGDYKYGKKNIKFKKINSNFIKLLKDFKGQALHAESIEFTHPTSKKRVSFKSNIPEDFKKMLDFLDNHNS